MRVIKRPSNLRKYHRYNEDKRQVVLYAVGAELLGKQCQWREEMNRITIHEKGSNRSTRRLAGAIPESEAVGLTVSMPKHPADCMWRLEASFPWIINSCALSPRCVNRGLMGSFIGKDLVDTRSFDRDSINRRELSRIRPRWSTKVSWSNWSARLFVRHFVRPRGRIYTGAQTIVLIAASSRSRFANQRMSRGGGQSMKSLEGQKAPVFSLEGHDGKTHSLEDYRGQKVVLFFYPKDNTPG